MYGIIQWLKYFAHTHLPKFRFLTDTSLVYEGRSISCVLLEEQHLAQFNTHQKFAYFRIGHEKIHTHTEE